MAYRIIVEWLLDVEIPANTKFEPGTLLRHGQGIVFIDHTVIGRHCILRHNTAIGCVMSPNRSQGPSPVIGDRVETGTNVVISGGIKIGDGAAIGAGSIVFKNVPANAVMVGHPGHVALLQIGREQPDDVPS